MTNRIATETIFSADRPAFLDSDMIRFKTYGVTLDQAGFEPDRDGNVIVLAGTPVGKLESGKYGLADGDEVPALFLTLVDCDLTDGDAEVAVFDWGRVIEARLPVEITDDMKLTLVGITFVPEVYPGPEES